MFWKNAKLNSPSLVSRLMLLYSLSTIGIILAIGLFMYPTLNKLIQHSTASSSLTIECFKNAIIALLASSLGSIVLGYIVAKKSLNKIHDFSEKMRVITIDSLDKRINPNDWPAELKTLGTEFNIMLDRLEQSFIRLSQFSSDISHELRNPLHNLMASTEVALTKSKTIDDYKSLLAAQLDEYHYLSKLIENLLFLAKADHGQLSIEKNCVSSQQEIAKACDYFQAMVDDKNIQLNCDGDEQIFVDTLLFKRVIVNLLSNAIKYTPENGVISIVTKKHSNNSIKISIQDSGIGIAEEHINRLFDRFYRVDSSRTQESGGLGLGLAIVKSIVDLHKGSVEIQSEMNIGTSIHLLLPHTSSLRGGR